MTFETHGEKTLQQAYEEYIRIKRVNNISKKTLQNYEAIYTYFTEYANTNTPCNEINHDTVVSYIEYLQKTRPKLSKISVNSYLRAIRTFLYFCMEQDYMSRFKITLIKTEKPLKEAYTEAELEKLLKKPDIKKCRFAEYRNWVMICYLLGTGNRRTTVCNLKIGDLDLETGEIKLKKVKNKKPYTIPISAFLEKILREYLVYRKGKDDDYLFCNVYGQKITEDGFNTCVQKYNASRGVLKFGIHLFRHTFAKKWILNGGDPFRLRVILGHSTMAMVNEYVNMYGSDLQKDFDIFSPLDNMECLKRNYRHIKMG
jgi:integrase/recombinase XerD